MWQVAGLTFLWYVGNPQSKEEEERNNEMLQWLVRKMDPKKTLKSSYLKWTTNIRKSNFVNCLVR
jgi:hypothetical protein